MCIHMCCEGYLLDGVRERRIIILFMSCRVWLFQNKTYGSQKRNKNNALEPPNDFGQTFLAVVKKYQPHYHVMLCTTSDFNSEEFTYACSSKIGPKATCKDSDKKNKKNIASQNPLIHTDDITARVHECLRASTCPSSGQMVLTDCPSQDCVFPFHDKFKNAKFIAAFSP